MRQFNTYVFRNHRILMNNFYVFIYTINDKHLVKLLNPLFWHFFCKTIHSVNILEPINIEQILGEILFGWEANW
jgi:hypothetical protein